MKHNVFYKVIRSRLPCFHVAALPKSAKTRDERNTEHPQRHLQTISNTVANLTQTEN